jgi:hypothetical protein
MDYRTLYGRFQSPILAFNCGDHCAPHNELGVPYCCDIRHVVPSAYQAEWEYLQANTDMWRPWEGRDREETRLLKEQASENQVLIACQGYKSCQRGYRSISCRAFPFFPYITRQGEFIGMSYYWEYELNCWVISNLKVVTPQYLVEFMATFDAIFDAMPEEKENFRKFSSLMRRVFGRRGRAIPLLHRNGHAYKVTPRDGKLRRVRVESLPKYGYYKLAAELPFPDEITG